MIGQTNTNPKELVVVKLPDLTKPATNAKILQGYQAYDKEGNVLTGTIPDVSGKNVDIYLNGTMTTIGGYADKIKPIYKYSNNSPFRVFSYSLSTHYNTYTSLDPTSQKLVRVGGDGVEKYIISDHPNYFGILGYIINIRMMQCGISYQGASYVSTAEIQASGDIFINTTGIFTELGLGQCLSEIPFRLYVQQVDGYINGKFVYNNTMFPGAFELLFDTSGLRITSSLSIEPDISFITNRALCVGHGN